VPALRALVEDLLRGLVPGAEQARFFRTIAGARSAGVLAARRFTRRSKVVSVVAGEWHDSTFRTIDRDTACVVVEQFELHPPPAEFLHELRNVCSGRGALLLLDESYTGFRVSPRGLQQHCGVPFDLVIFSEAIANGMPLTAITGAQRYIQSLEQEGFAGFSTGDALSFAAAAATLHALGDANLAVRAEIVGRNLMDGCNRLANQLNVDFFSCVGWPARSALRFTPQGDWDQPRMTDFLERELFRHGVIGRGIHNLCASHGDEEIERVLSAYEGALPALVAAVTHAKKTPHRIPTAATPALPRRSPRKRILFIGGDILQTKQLHKVAQTLLEHELYFTPYYGDLFLNVARELGWVEYAIVGRKRGQRCIEFAREHGYPIDLYGEHHGPYDLVVTCSDVVVPQNIRGNRIVVVQEGIMDPEHRSYKLIKAFPFLPKWLAGTAYTGQSGMYEAICVAAEGWKRHLLARGVPAERIRVTGIPEFDDCERFRKNSFPHRDYVLVCTSDTRETWKKDDRKAFIARCLRIAAGRQMIIKPHPNEIMERSLPEFRRYAPEALIVTEGCAEEMAANCSVLITQWSTLVLVGLALGKECYSGWDVSRLRELVPLQNGGTSHQRIGEVCRELLGELVARPRASGRRAA
jgi:hypothetical protein